MSSRIEAVRSIVVRAVRSGCPSWLRDQAEDIAQEALIRLAAALSRQGERVETLSSSYLRKAAYSATIDVVRKRREEHRLVVEMDASAPDRMRATGADPEIMAASAELGRAITDCVSRLVRPRRVAAILHLQGHTVPEIAGLTAWTETKANNLVYRGLADVRKCLERKGLAP